PPHDLSPIVQLHHHSACPHPALPPFPTRRSSDLAIHPFTKCPRRSLRLDVRFLDDARVRGVVPLDHRRELLRGPRTHHVVQFAQDRKSTRLNSSHDQISYAVFCLKKKIVQPFVAH